MNKGQFKPIPIERRLWDKLEPTGDCWLFTGLKNKNGYGVIITRHPNRAYVHRVAYELANECKIDPHLQIDHLCRNRACANPHHLEEVTSKTNTNRGIAAEVHRAMRFKASHCKHGHEWTPENTLFSNNGHVRHCRECNRIKRAEYRARAKTSV